MKSLKSKFVRRQKGKRPRKTRAGHPSLARPASPTRQTSEQDWRVDQDAELLLLALFGRKPWCCTPFETIAQECPVVWTRALEVFGGNRVAARKWLETRSPAFHGKCHYTVALQVGGERRVLRELTRLA